MLRVTKGRNSKARIASGFVYFMRSERLVKIGFSRDPEFRFRHIRAMTPGSLELVAIHPGSKRDEASLHLKFAGIRRQGEWFEWTDEIAAVAEHGFEPMDDRVRRDKNGDVVVSSIVASVARKFFPVKTAVQLAFLTGCSERACQLWLAGQGEIGSRPLVSLLTSEMGPELLQALHHKKSLFVR